MSKAFDNFCFIAEFKIPVAVELSLYIGVPLGGCGWPSSMRAVRMGQARWVAMKIPPVSASAADAMTFLMVLHITWRGALVVGVDWRVGSVPRLYQAAARERACGRTR